jgi:predicted ATP-dependent serine protease
MPDGVPRFHKIPARVEPFVGRHIELHQVIAMLIANRFVTIKGIPGIGKSSLCIEVINMMFERRTFRDGMIYVPLLGIDRIEGFVTSIANKIGDSAEGIVYEKSKFGELIERVADSLSQKFD